MFGRHQKTQTDIKKSTQKLLDSKKDVSYRLKHLKVILGKIFLSEVITCNKMAFYQFNFVILRKFRWA